MPYIPPLCMKYVYKIVCDSIINLDMLVCSDINDTFSCNYHVHTASFIVYCQGGNERTSELPFIYNI